MKELSVKSRALSSTLQARCTLALPVSLGGRSLNSIRLMRHIGGSRAVALLFLTLPWTHALSLKPLSAAPHQQHGRRHVTCLMSSTVDSLPMEPATELGLTAQDTVRVVCNGLRLNDTPSPDSGVVRLYHFTTPRGRVAIAPPPPRQGLQGGVSLEYFIEEAGSEALGAMIFCSEVKLIGEPVVSPAGPARGQIATQLVEVGNNPLEDDSDGVATLQALCKAPDSFLEEVIAFAGGDGVPMPAAPPEAQIKKRF